MPHLSYCGIAHSLTSCLCSFITIFVTRKDVKSSPSHFVSRKVEISGVFADGGVHGLPSATNVVVSGSTIFNIGNHVNGQFSPNGVRQHCHRLGPCQIRRPEWNPAWLPVTGYLFPSLNVLNVLSKVVTANVYTQGRTAGGTPYVSTDIFVYVSSGTKGEVTSVLPT